MELMKGSEDWNVFADIFNYFKRFYEVKVGTCDDPAVEKYWHELIDSGNAIVDKYKGTNTHSLAEKLVISVINEFEYRMNKERDRHGTNYS